MNLEGVYTSTSTRPSITHLSGQYDIQNGPRTTIRRAATPNEYQATVSGIHLRNFLVDVTTKTCASDEYALASSAWEDAQHDIAISADRAIPASVNLTGE